MQASGVGWAFKRGGQMSGPAQTGWDRQAQDTLSGADGVGVDGQFYVKKGHCSLWGWTQVLMHYLCIWQRGHASNKAQLPPLSTLRFRWRGRCAHERMDKHNAVGELVLGREVYASHCGNPGGKLLISFLMMGQVPGKASQRRWHGSCREFRD